MLMGQSANGIYERLGVRRLINAGVFATNCGSSIMPPEVLAAMNEASHSYVNLVELLARAGERIAALTHNEACFVTTGAAAGLLLATAACITGTDPVKTHQLPDLTGLKNEVVIHRQQRNGYDHAVRSTGIRFREIAYDQRATAPWELEAAINPNTAAIVYIFNTFTPEPHAHPGFEGPLPLQDVVAIAHKHGVPVIVDIANQLPPAERLWKYTQMGADLAVCSGGKALRGPGCTGLILGRKDLIEACAVQANPNGGIGRPAKVGKEEIAGIVTAVERYMSIDHEAEASQWESTIAYFVDELGRLPHVATRRTFPSRSSWEVPSALITVRIGEQGISRDELVARMREGNPYIVCQLSGLNSIGLCPVTLQAGDAEFIVQRIKEIVQTHKGGSEQ